MTFFDEKGNQIRFEHWLKTYEPYYFLNGPKWGRRINGRNQSSPFVEDNVCGLLSKTPPLSKDDLVLAMAWKIGGLIDHGSSEVAQKIVYLQDWPTMLSSTGRFRTSDFSTSIPYLARNMAAIARTSRGNPQYLLDLPDRRHGGFVPARLEGFGLVYRLTVLFFITQGMYPIYDRFAHVAAEAICGDLPPGSHVPYKAIQGWAEYRHYMKLLEQIRKASSTESADSSMFIPRPLDRALWVYGHFFADKSQRGCEH